MTIMKVHYVWEHRLKKETIREYTAISPEFAIKSYVDNTLEGSESYYRLLYVQAEGSKKEQWEVEYYKDDGEYKINRFGE